MIVALRRVKDDSGNIIPGLVKDDKGALIVNDVAEFNKYKRQKELLDVQQARIDSLGKEVDELKNLVKQLLEKR